MFETHKKSIIQRVYILRRQIFIMSKMVYFDEFFKTWSLRSVLPDMSILRQKLMENVTIKKFKCDILGDFQALCSQSAFIDAENIRNNYSSS